MFPLQLENGISFRLCNFEHTGKGEFYAYYQKCLGNSNNFCSGKTLEGPTKIRKSRNPENEFVNCSATWNWKIEKKILEKVPKIQKNAVRRLLKICLEYPFRYCGWFSFGCPWLGSRVVSILGQKIVPPRRETWEQLPRWYALPTAAWTKHENSRVVTRNVPNNTRTSYSILKTAIFISTDNGF